MKKIVKWTLIAAVFFGFGIYGQHLQRQEDLKAQQQGWPSAEIRDEAFEAGYAEPDAWLALKREEYAKQSAIEQAAAVRAALEEANRRASEEISQPGVAEPTDVVKVEQEASESSSDTRWLEILSVFVVLGVAYLLAVAREKWELENHDALAERDKRLHEKELLDAEVERMRELNELELEKTEQLHEAELHEVWQRARSEQLNADAQEQQLRTQTSYSDGDQSPYTDAEWQAALDRLHDDEPVDAPQYDSDRSGHSWVKSITGGILGGLAAGLAQSARTEDSDSYEPRGYTEPPRYRDVKIWGCRVCGLELEQLSSPYTCPSPTCKSNTSNNKYGSPFGCIKSYRERIN